MRMSRKQILAPLFLFIIFLTSSLHAYCLKTAFLRDCKCGDPWTLRLEGGYTFGQFIGQNKSYGEIGLFVAPKHCGKAQDFIEARGFLLENGNGAASVGVGRRLWILDTCRILGFNLYYDFRHGDTGTFNRIGVGLEYLGACWDIRANGYFPLHDGSREGKKHVFDDFEGPFVETCQRKELTFLGYDIELGKTFWNDCSCRLYAAIGPYFYHHSELKGIYGGFARLKFSFSDWVWAEARVSSDNMFDTNFQGTIMITLPLYQMFTCGCTPNPCRDLLTQPVERNWLMFTRRCCSRHYNWDD